MRCKRHTIDLRSSIGVCASCLRERLISIAASTAASENEYSDHHHSHSLISPPPLFFPRSVSPYVAPRKSDAGIVVGDSKPRLFATPQVGPTHGGGGRTSEKVFDSERSFKKKRNGLSRFSSFFRTRSADYDSSSTFLSPSSSSSSRSWLSKVLSVKSKKQTTCYIEDLIDSESENHRNRPRQRFCRGMSPAGDSYDGESEQRRTPAMGTPVRKKTAMTTTMGFCLSPLVRAKPNNSSNIWKGKFPPEFGYSGELKSPANPHISTAASFCGNRSKKLVDLGRVDPRH